MNFKQYSRKNIFIRRESSVIIAMLDITNRNTPKYLMDALKYTSLSIAYIPVKKRNTKKIRSKKMYLFLNRLTPFFLITEYKNNKGIKK